MEQLDLFEWSRSRASESEIIPEAAEEDSPPPAAFTYPQERLPSRQRSGREAPSPQKRQLSLLREESHPYQVSQPQVLEMTGKELQQWKQRIAEYQYAVRLQPPPQQIAAIADLPSQTDPNAIDPFFLHVYPWQFFRQPAPHPGKPCLYFVLDRAVPLLLYVGETVASNQRWKGVHYCKQYVGRYLELNREHGFTTQVAIAFYWNVPAETRPRQQLERNLIYKWRSPFNKEMWSLYAQPFPKSYRPS